MSFSVFAQTTPDLPSVGNPSDPTVEDVSDMIRVFFDTDFGALMQIALVLCAVALIGYSLMTKGREVVRGGGSLNTSMVVGLIVPLILGSMMINLAWTAQVMFFLYTTMVSLLVALAGLFGF